MKDLEELWPSASVGTLEDEQRPPGGPGGTYVPRERLSGGREQHMQTLSVRNRAWGVERTVPSVCPYCQGSQGG